MLKLPAEILLATSNPHKVRELRAILTPLLTTGTKLLSLADIGQAGPPADVERFNTFTANARAKAKWCRDRYGMSCLADDSGICVHALGEAPGVRSARWAGPGDSDRNEMLLGELIRVGAIEPQQRAARFVCSAAFAVAESPAAVVALGIASGRIVDHPSGETGFGYDPIFYCPELESTFALAPEAAKNRVSHRARAFSRLIAQICPAMS